MSLVVTIIVITCVVSIVAFSRQVLFYRLALCYYEVVEGKELYRLLTHMFVHGSISHLLINMLVFYSFAVSLYQDFDYLASCGVIHFPCLQFLGLYFGGGITAGLFSLLLRKDRNIPSVGASGGVAALVFATIFFDPWTPLYIFGLVPLPGIILGAAYLVYSWIMGRRGRDHIDHHAHFYGALYGLVFPIIAIDYHLLQNFFNLLLGHS